MNDLLIVQPASSSSSAVQWEQIPNRQPADWLPGGLCQWSTDSINNAIFEYQLKPPKSEHSISWTEFMDLFVVVDRTQSIQLRDCDCLTGKLKV